MKHLTLLTRALVALTTLSMGCGGDDATPEPGNYPPLVINEFMAKNRFTLLDDSGVPFDWVEIYNDTDASVSLAGWSLRSGADAELSAEIPGSVNVPAKGYAVLFLVGDLAGETEHVELLLEKEGGSLQLLDPDGAIVNDIRYGLQGSDLSASRSPDGSDQWSMVFDVTPGAKNGDGDGQALAIGSEEVIADIRDLSEELLGEDVIAEFDLELSDASLAALRATPREYVEGSLTYRGRTFSPIGVRLKGQNSFDNIDGKPSFRLEMDTYVEGAELFGLDDLTLNNMKSDPSRMHERMAYRAARLAGVASPRSAFGFIRMNGRALGLYAQVEHVEPRMLARYFDDAEGSLYEVTDADLVVTPFPDPDEPQFTIGSVDDFEYKSGPDDRARLVSLAEGLEAAPATAVSNAGPFVDITSFKRYWAAMGVIAQFDAYPFSYDDYYIYQDPSTNLLHFIPWGMDETLTDLIRWPLAGEAVLPDKCQKDDPCRLSVRDEMWVVQNLLESEGWAAEFDRIQGAIAPFIALEESDHYTNMQILAGQQDLKDFLADRRENLALPRQLGPE